MRFFDREASNVYLWLGVNSRPNAIAFLVALTLFISLLVLIAVGPVWRLYGWLGNDTLGSDSLRVTHSLATRWLYRPPDVIFVGGSQIRESLPTEEFMDRALSRACGRPVEVFNAASSAQPLESSWSLVERLGPRAPALVVAGVNVFRNVRADGGSRHLARMLLPLGAPEHMSVEMGALDLTVPERLQSRMATLFIDARRAILTSEKRRFDSPFDGAHNQYAPPGISSERRLLDSVYAAHVASQLSDAQIAFNVSVYLHFGEFVRARGGRMIFLLPPVPNSTATVAELESRTLRALAPLTDANEVLSLRSHTSEVDEDFFDSVHMLRTGREKFWPELEQALIARLPQCEALT
jgi:hypothetical protein